MEQTREQEKGEQRRKEQQQQQLQQHIRGPDESTRGRPVPAPLPGRFLPAASATPSAPPSSDFALDAAAHSLCNGTLVFWAASGAAPAATAVSKPPSCLQQALGEPYEAGETRQNVEATFQSPVGTGSFLSFHTVGQQRLLQRQQRHAGASSSTLMRHVLLAEEERAAFFSPERLPLVLCLCSRGISPVQQQQRPAHNAQRGKLLSTGDPHSSSVSAFRAAIEAGNVTKTTRVAAATGTKVPDGYFLLSFLWVVASWSPRLTDPLPVSAVAAAADLGLRSTTSARAEALAIADPSAAAEAARIAGGFPALQQRCVGAASTTIAASASLRGGICLRLAALRALAYWCCCCTLAEQEATHNVQRNRIRQQQKQQMVFHAAPPRTSNSETETRRESTRTSSSIALLRQLQQECRESFAQLLLQQQDAQRQLAERQGIEMEAACALREKQEQALKAAVAARSESCTDKSDAKDPTVVAAAALEACERDLQELVQQHLSECELLERHWKHEQQLLRKQQLHMFKNVAADLYLLQHGSAAVHGAACQELVLPPLPSADETERWTFNWKQQQQEQQRQEQLLHDQQQPTWRQVGMAARQLFRRRGGSPSQDGTSSHDSSRGADCTPAAAGAPDTAKEERLRSSGAVGPHLGSAAVAAAAISALMGATAAAGQKCQQQQQQNQQTAHNGSAQLRQTVQHKQQQQQQKQQGLQGSSMDLTAGATHSQLRKQHQRQLAVAAAAHQGPVFDMPRLLQGIAAGAMQPQQRRPSGMLPQQQQPRQLGGVQEHAEVRLIFGAQRRRTIWLHVCTGLTADFFPSSTAAAPEQQNEQQLGSATVSCAGEWLSLLGQGSTAFPEEQLADWPGGSSSYCYKDVRNMRDSPLYCSVGSSGRLSCGDPLSWPEADGLSDDLFAALKSGPRASLSGAVLPTGAAMQESCGCIELGNDTPDLLLPSLEEQRRLLRAAMHSVRRSSNYLGSQQRLLLQQGEVFVSRHAARLRPQVCFHLAVASAGTSHEASQTSSPSAAAQSAEAPLKPDNKRRSSAGDDLDSPCAPVCEGLRQILRLCEKHAVGALLLPALLLETETSASCLPVALLQRRMLAVLRCVVAELRTIALSPVSSSCCSSGASIGGLRHIVLLLPPIQQQQQEGSGQMNLLVQAAVNFLRNSAYCC
ncbi:uncharacterized protein EMH_0032240 [Eimeria mitis]|uniref:Uncharacterized protein n=1 Tax=Eimeria mitis TaxID=44415 RepID=U6KH25_9EIME|nr:uncharacterized protein EMH_0032240 [Eimeria mitis]CDJ36086.1 hypothetical protein, conserved [Eimeria mitis]